jgi:hypothetical protein
MRHLWLKIRLPLAIFILLVFTLIMVRVFSGPEDTWIKNDQGEWVKHGAPAGSPPADGRQPLRNIILPLLFIAGFAVPLFFIGFHKLHNRLTFDIAKRDMKVFGYLSTAFPLVGVLIMVGLLVELGFAQPDEALPVQDMLFTMLFIFSLEGFAGLCILAGVVCLAMKRTTNDHYQLERSRRELLEILEKHTAQ